MKTSQLTSVVTVVLVLVGVLELTVAGASSCSASCIVQKDIISCRRFDRPADIRACARRHPSVSVLDLSYIDVRHALTRRSLSGLKHVVVLYLDGSRVRHVDVDALADMRQLQMIFARHMRGSLAALLDAVVGSPSVRELALADNFVVCSCKWLRVVQRLAAADVVIIDWLDAAPRCSEETVRRCRATNDRTHEDDGGQNSMVAERPVMGLGRDQGPSDNQPPHHHQHQRRQATSPSSSQGGGEGGGPLWIAHPGTIVLLILLVLIIIFIIVFFATPLKHKLVRPPPKEDEGKRSSSARKSDSKGAFLSDSERTSGAEPSLLKRLSSKLSLSGQGEAPEKSQSLSGGGRPSKGKSSTNVNNRALSEPTISSTSRQSTVRSQSRVSSTVVTEENEQGPRASTAASRDSLPRLSVKPAEQFKLLPAAITQADDNDDDGENEDDENVSNNINRSADNDDTMSSKRRKTSVRELFHSKMSALRHMNLGKSLSVNNSNVRLTSTSWSCTSTSDNGDDELTTTDDDSTTSTGYIVTRRQW